MGQMTEFLPAERVTTTSLESVAKRLQESLFAGVFESLPVGIMVINETRQTLYCNGVFGGLAEEVGNHELLGMRPGEALGCVHALDSNHGCGTTRFCRHCGAANAVLESLRGNTGFQECLLQRSHASSHDSLVLQIVTVPFHFEEEQYILFAGFDTSHEKRALEMERLVFHKFLNSASGLLMLSNLMAEESNGALPEYAGHLRNAAKGLASQIRTYQVWGAVEQGRYVPACDELRPLSLLAQVLEENFSEGSPASCSFATECTFTGTIQTDTTLVTFILTALLENAVEARAEDSLVTVACLPTEQGVAFQVSNIGSLTSVQRARMFKRAFSTKEDGRGFGLYRAKLALKRYLGGDIGFTEKDGRVQFQMDLPLVIPTTKDERI